MLRDRKDNWEFPGGRIEFGEHLEDALKRELMEELSVEDVRIGNIIDARDFAVSKDEADYQFVVVVYECFFDDKKIDISDEHSAYEWIAIDDMDKYRMKKGYKDSIKKFKEGALPKGNEKA